MDSRIRLSVEKKRGCGYRKQGGKYLVGTGTGRDCGKLPLPLDVCPCCHAGIKQSRGWTWINANEMFRDISCKKVSIGCNLCPMAFLGWVDVEFRDAQWDKVGLLWIGEKYYKTTSEFIAEATTMGLSRRISAVPRDFKLGETWVFLAHPKAIYDPASKLDEFVKYNPGIFYVFRPTAIEHIVSGNETEQEIDTLINRGLSLVKVEIEQETENPLIGGEIGNVGEFI